MGKIPFGVITTHDVVRAIATHEGVPKNLTVADAMTTDIMTSRSKDAIKCVEQLMNTYHVRHVLVRDGDRLCGPLSLEDVQQAHCEELEFENHCMRSYIQGDAAELTTTLST
jgi:CBS domain-containing protein